MKDEIISIEEIEPSPRGKRIDWNQDLLKKFKALPKNKAIKLGETFGTIEHEEKERARISHLIKRHWEKVRRDSPSVNFSPDGIPQVKVKR